MANLSAYKLKYGNICELIDKYYENIKLEKNSSKNEKLNKFTLLRPEITPRVNSKF